ncbi:MAG: tetratricopeptide repeat protein [Reyranella sp.]|uniref:tetratricopeptide repeat protein n=1 Tax=Reyranella sp. TaxID=1929291 RepID=UPI0012087F70|nr:tetratricopeptide repeat-containing glycosyltransferase family protein [Reyranella sp.]TAJ39307.1 MAG: tetratricopeptide repeat protein [Reyranella sp.]
MALSDQKIQALGRDGLQLAARGDFAGAEALFAQAAEARPNSGQLLHLLGQVRLKLGRFAEAREPLERAASFLPRDAAAQINLAGCLGQLGQHDAALATLERAAELKPGDAAIAFNRGRALEILGRTDEAEHAYDEALSIDHRLMPALSARAGLLAARGDWVGALGDLDRALATRPDEHALKLRRGELLLRQGDWSRGLIDHEARLDIAGDRYTPALPRWQGEPLGGPLLIYPEQSDIDSDEAARDTLMLARGVDAVVQCAAWVAELVETPTIRRAAPLEGFAAAAPLRSLPHLLGWTLESLPPPGTLRPKAQPSARIGWFARTAPPSGTVVESDPAQVATCRFVVGNDTAVTHIAALLGIPTLMLVPSSADWLWGPRRGPSPWYPSLEVAGEDDSEKLAAWLGRR